MVGNAVVFVLFAILLQSVPSHQAIRCLECNSHNNSMCIDPLAYDKESIIKYIPIVQCGHGIIHKDGQYGQGEFFCRKVVQTTLGGSFNEGSIMVTRGCGRIRSKEECYSQDRSDLGLNVRICQCFNDYCNGAAAHALLLPLMVAAVAVYVAV